MVQTSERELKIADYLKLAPTPDTDGGKASLAEHLGRYKWVVARKEERLGRILDAGCGLGFGTKLVANKANLAVGVDFNAEVILYAQESFGNVPRLFYGVCDCTTLPFVDASFDTITCFELFEHVPDPVALIREIARVTKPDGTVFISTPNAIWHTGETFLFHYREYTLEEFTALLRTAFSAVEVFGQRTMDPRFQAFTAHPLFMRLYRMVKSIVPRGVRERLRRPIIVDADLVNAWVVTSDAVGTCPTLIAICSQAR